MGFVVRIGVRISVLATAVTCSLLIPAEAAPADAAVPACFGTAATIVGTPRSDVITGTARRDVIQAGRGNDHIRGLKGDDTICGGPGNDRIRAGAGNDRVDDGLGRDVAWGGPGDDRFEFREGSDRAFGGSGADFFQDRLGSDAFFGGPGPDQAVGDSDTSSDLYDLGSDDDSAVAGRGSDVVLGGSGSDLLSFGCCADAVFDGGDGTDTVRVGWSCVYKLGCSLPGPFMIDLTAGRVRYLWSPPSEHGNLTLVAIENASGSNDDDVLIGDAANNVLEGNAGADHIQGMGGDDRLVATPGWGLLEGGDGTDTCLGGHTLVSCELTAVARLERLFPGGASKTNAFG
jgi:Ca2+-binding RTX toxin-like protein